MDIDTGATLTFRSFWDWLTHHPNCILRAGTPETIIYDDEDLHWHFAIEPPNLFLVQVLRGKRAMSEIFVQPEHVSYVQTSGEDAESEHTFELITETDTDLVTTYFFVLTHGFIDEESEELAHGPVH